jgi:hypothetical protein
LFEDVFLKRKQLFFFSFKAYPLSIRDLPNLLRMDLNCPKDTFTSVVLPQLYRLNLNRKITMTNFDHKMCNTVVIHDTNICIVYLMPKSFFYRTTLKIHCYYKRKLIIHSLLKFCCIFHINKKSIVLQKRPL